MKLMYIGFLIKISGILAIITDFFHSITKMVMGWNKKLHVKINNYLDFLKEDDSDYWGNPEED